MELLIANNQPLRSAGVATDYATFFVTGQKLDLGPQGEITVRQAYSEVEDEAPRPKAVNYKVDIKYDSSMPVKDLLDYISKPPGATSPGFDKAALIQALNIVLTRTANEDRLIFGGGNSNKFYEYPTDQNKWFALGGGLIALKGVYTSVRTSTARVLVNINVANAAFYPAMNLLGLMRLHTPNPNNDQVSGLEGFIGGLKVSHNYIRNDKKDPKSTVKRVKTVLGFAHPIPKEGHDFPLYGNAHQIKFLCGDLQPPAKISVFDYFKRSESGAPSCP